MIDPELVAKLDAIDAKAQAAYVAAEKARKYLFWTGMVSIVVIVLPMIGLVFAIPMFMNNYVEPLNALTSTGTTGNSGGTSAGSLNDTLNTLSSLGL